MNQEFLRQQQWIHQPQTYEEQMQQMAQHIQHLQQQLEQQMLQMKQMEQHMQVQQIQYMQQIEQQMEQMRLMHQQLLIHQMQLHRSVLDSFKNKYVPQLIVGVDDTYPPKNWWGENYSQNSRYKTGTLIIANIQKNLFNNGFDLRNEHPQATEIINILKYWDHRNYGPDIDNNQSFKICKDAAYNGDNLAASATSKLVLHKNSGFWGHKFSCHEYILKETNLSNCGKTLNTNKIQAEYIWHRILGIDSILDERKAHQWGTVFEVLMYVAALIRPGQELILFNDFLEYAICNLPIRST